MERFAFAGCGHGIDARWVPGKCAPAEAPVVEPASLMDAYLPIFFMAVLAVIFAGASLVASVMLAPKRRPHEAKVAPYECGIVPDREPAETLPRPLLSGGDDLHNLRHRDRLPLSVGGRLPPARPRSATSRFWSSPERCSSPSFTW